MSKHKLSDHAGEGRVRVLCIHMPHKVLARHTVPTVIARELSFLNGRSESQHSGENGGTVLDLGEISNIPAQRGRLSSHECIETHPFWEDFDKIGNF